MEEKEVILFCNAAQCTHPKKIIDSAIEGNKHHNGHVTQSIPELKLELQKKGQEKVLSSIESKDILEEILNSIHTQVE